MYLLQMENVYHRKKTVLKLRMGWAFYVDMYKTKEKVFGIMTYWVSKHSCLWKSLQCMRSMYKTFVNIIEHIWNVLFKLHWHLQLCVHRFDLYCIFMEIRKKTRQVFGFIGYKDKSNFDISTWVLNWRFRAATLTAFSTGVNIILNIPNVFVVYMFTVSWRQECGPLLTTAV